MYMLAPGISISFNQIYTNSWMKGDGEFFSEQMLILNFCIRGRCDVSLTGNQYAIVKERQVCASTILPTKDFYYPGRKYDGVQIYLDLSILRQQKEENLLTVLGIDAEKMKDRFCAGDGLYVHRMDDILFELVQKTWDMKNDPNIGTLRYYMVCMLHELMKMPCVSEFEGGFTRSQIAIVKETESIIMEDFSKKYTAKEMAGRFGISESSFKLYVKGILGESYLAYFRRKRMEKAAELLETTDLKVIEIANAVSYENQGKFAKVFADTYGTSPIEYRRLKKSDSQK